jgi:hypothetical protein
MASMTPQSLQELRPPEQQVKQRVASMARVIVRIQSSCQVQPKGLTLRRQLVEHPSRPAALAAALAAVIDQPPEILTIVSGGVEQAPCRSASGIQKSQSPAMITNDRSDLKGGIQESPSVLDELSSQTARKIQRIVMVGSDGRAASEAAQFFNWSTKRGHRERSASMFFLFIQRGTPPKGKLRYLRGRFDSPKTIC